MCKTCEDTGLFTDEYGEEIACPDCKRGLQADLKEPLTIDDYNQEYTIKEGPYKGYKTNRGDR
jgi:hypothetical protein